MIFYKYPDGFAYYGREMLEALEAIIQKAEQHNTLVERFSFSISNGLQV